MKNNELITLREKIKNNGVMNLEDCKKSFLPLLKEIRKKHKDGILLCYISPDSIIVQANGKLDLFLDDEDFFIKNKECSNCYLSPEQFEKKPVGKYSDIYSICATIYFCLTKNDPPSIDAQKKGQVFDIPTESPESIISKGLEHDLNKRIKDIDELLQIIQKRSKATVIFLNNINNILKCVAYGVFLYITGTALGSISENNHWPWLICTALFPKFFDFFCDDILKIIKQSTEDIKYSAKTRILQGIRKHSFEEWKKTVFRFLSNLYLHAAVVIFCLFVIMAAKSFTPRSGSCGENAKWKIKDHELHITGYGDMYDYGNELDFTPSWNVFSEEIFSVDIANGITSIGDEAFRDCTKIKEVSIPDSVVVIGKLSFEGCLELKSVSIPDSVLEIKGYAFYHCEQLETVKLPQNITEIANGLFDGCTRLAKVDIPDNVENIGECSFYNCEMLCQVSIPPNVTVIKNSAFENCFSLGDISLNEGLQSIGSSAFSNCGFTEIVLPQTLKSIDAFAFSECYWLETVKIPQNVEAIKYRTFENCSSLETIVLPNEVKVIEDGAFYGCEELQNINIPINTISIGKWTFAGCEKLSTITIPSEVETVATEAFVSCKGLKEFIVDGDNTTYISVDGVLYNKDMTSLLMYPTGKNDNSFTIPEGVNCIEKSAFIECETLHSVKMPETVTSIKEDSFAGCSMLSDISFSDNVTFIEKNAFNGCSSIRNIVLPKCLVGIHEAGFAGCSSLQSITFYRNITYIGSRAFSSDDKLTTVNYDGTESEWYSIEKEDFGNETLINAQVNFDYQI